MLGSYPLPTALLESQVPAPGPLPRLGQTLSNYSYKACCHYDFICPSSEGFEAKRGLGFPFHGWGTKAWEPCGLPRPPAEEKAGFSDSPGLFASPTRLLALVLTTTVAQAYLEPGITMSPWQAIHAAITIALHSGDKP